MVTCSPLIFNRWTKMMPSTPNRCGIGWMPIFDRWREALPGGGPIPEEAEPYFSAFL